MKKWKRILAIVLCLTFVSVPADVLTQPIAVEAAAKSGLVKENGKYYYYAKGKILKNTWKTVAITSNGKKTNYRYYFGKDGAAYAGKKIYGINTPSVKKIDGKYYGFGVSGRMLKGTYVVSEKFYVFDSKTGIYDSVKSSRLRKASVYEKDAKDLKKLLGKPKKTDVYQSCYGDGKDSVCYYSNFIVSYFRDKKGKEIVLGISGK